MRGILSVAFLLCLATPTSATEPYQAKERAASYTISYQEDNKKVASTGDKTNSKPDETTELTQTNLMMLGYDLSRDDIDGIFGPKTARALAKFQEDMGLPVTERTDYLTQLALHHDPIGFSFCIARENPLTLCLAAIARTSGQSPIKIPAAYDESIAKAVFASALKEGKLVNDHEANQVVNQVVSRLKKAYPTPWPIRVAVLESNEVNAYTFGGGCIVLLKGITKKCRTDAELAFVLSHEIAHGLLRHVAQNLDNELDDTKKLEVMIASESGSFSLPRDIVVAAGFRKPTISVGFRESIIRAIIAVIKKATGRGERAATRGIERGAEEALGSQVEHSAGDVPNTRGRGAASRSTLSPFERSAGQTIGRYASEYIERFSQSIKKMKYSRQQELEADRLAIEILTQAGYDLKEALTLLESFSDHSTLPLFSTHPNPSDRIQQIRKQIDNIGKDA